MHLYVKFTPTRDKINNDWFKKSWVRLNTNLYFCKLVFNESGRTAETCVNFEKKICLLLKFNKFNLDIVHT